MSEHSELLLVEMLIKHGLFSKADFEVLMKTRPLQESSIRAYIVKKNLVTEKHILDILHAEFGYPIVNLMHCKPTPLCLQKVSLMHATSFSVFPVREESGIIILGMVDILDNDLMDDVRFSLNANFKIELLSLDGHKELISTFYDNKTEENISGSEDLNFINSDKIDNDEVDPSVNDAPVVVLLNNILMQAINDHASDIHFEPFENEFKIRYRIDGTLYEMIPPPRDLALSVLSRIKVMAKMNIAEKRVPQDGRISLKVNNKPVDLRVSTLPTTFGESAVLRILDRSHIQLDLEKLGMNQDILKKIRTIINKPNGIFITTGPTGAGKTTTLYSCLKEINTIDAKIITTEDPVEYEIEGITQVAINENIGLSFESCLRSILRQDPDKIMVGEIRDLPTMNMAIQASLTGHLVLTTLHTNDSASAITRLIDMGVEPFLICSSLEAILAQRLIRTICNECKTPVMPNEDIIKSLGINKKNVSIKTFYQGKGCDACNGIGYKGRCGIYELLIINDEIRKLIMQRATATKIRDAAVQSGMVLLIDDGINKIEVGVTTIEEISLWISSMKK